ncbi:MAG: threonine ammonia-lyase [Pyrinomonadaceae bacterium]
MVSAAQKTSSRVIFNRTKTTNFLRTIQSEADSNEIIKLDEIQKAAERIAPYIKRTPTLRDDILSRRFGSNFYLKYELLQNTGAFKVRGAFNKMLTLDDEEKKRGIVAVSGGNHAKAVAYASQTLGFQALILMPELTPQNYISETKGYGAEVRLFPTMAQAFKQAKEQAKEYEQAGRVYIHPFDDETVVAGQGTIGLEILEDVPQVTDIIVSIGGGGLAGGVAAAIKSTKLNVKIWGVETRGAESMRKALDADKIVELAEITSIARTLGAPAVSQLTFDLARKYLLDVTVVDDSEAVREMFYLLDNAKVLTEPATSCTLAAAERLRENFTPESHVVLILCGGNISLGDLFELKQVEEKKI